MDTQVKNARVQFKPEPVDGFYRTLKKEAAALITTDQRFASPLVWVKAIAFLGILTGAAIAINLGWKPVLLWYIAIGVCMHVLTLHVVHDAAHDVLSKKKIWNRLALYIMDLMGGDGRIWRQRHIHGHHPFPNILGKDVDIGQSKVVVIFPGMPAKSIHKYQHLYMPFVYPFYTMYWFFFRDWQNLFALAGAPVFVQKPSVMRVIGFFFVKLQALFWQLTLPILLMPQLWPVFVLGFIAMHATASILGAFVLLSSHVDGESDFTQPDEKGNMPFTWAEHQVVSNADFSTNSTFWTIFFGGFNHHIAHHLFPYISKSKLAPLTPLIRQRCQEFGIPYRDMPFGRGLTGHIRFLRRDIA